MADDKIQLVAKDGRNYVPNEDPPNYTPVAQQQVMMNQYGQPVVHQQMVYAQPAGQPYGQPAGQMQYAPSGAQQQMQYAPPGAQQQMQYSLPGQQTVVVTQPSSQTIVVQNCAPRPPTWMWLSCVVFWCCNPIAGGIAFILSVMSASAADENDNKHASRLGKASLWTSVAGVAITIIGVIIGVVIIVEAAKTGTDEFGNAVQESLNNINTENNNINNNFNDNGWN